MRESFTSGKILGDEVFFVVSGYVSSKETPSGRGYHRDKSESRGYDKSLKEEKKGGWAQCGVMWTVLCYEIFIVYYFVIC
jgi:hypothetical protein